ncbi:cupin [Rhodoferax lacus]|uniref:Cupin n=1 Tax=Rhodoferax lacus TaxID=2184758 RepID=A0A3E1R818_9BURK|nr:cupin domain-containing protein [Rhodoferax lacus]RFO95457.1 cupin [Rhodoferax lacus]
MDINTPLQLLGGISPETFMRRYWEKKPLLIRAAIPGFKPLLDRAELIDLAAQDDVESRLVVSAQADKKGQWRLKHGPFARKDLPPFKQAGWTVLVQGVDLHDERVHQLMNQFRFVPDARLDDVMISYASDTGGVGPHFDSYDVFLLQAHGRRRWRIGRQKDLSLVPDMPVKILANFVPEQEFVLEPGDMLYLPPQWAHDGIAEGECMTYSIGFRSPVKGEIARELLQCLAEQAADDVGPAIYRDPEQPAVSGSGEIPAGLLQFAKEALDAALKDPLALQRSLGEIMTEPKAHVWFHGNQELEEGVGVRLDRRTRMMYDAKHVFINGESFRAAGSDAKRMRKLADERELNAAEVSKLSEPARELLLQWGEDGWLYGLV